ncbi:GNAT family N-acetyltransferase [Agromyces marinus]|uniref:N-acetyltransferase n=1 Tax=Agromyces marinus TaxID=1389020 RepID=A0ABM8GXZ9_9MICO|nr:GNAT family N-acetyltransferase [Agromyces marinus]UIP58376.1 hypothetical protein DSM26151_12500 [Agromyces marinus]BDZ53369.1 N-acetyltransferase [Agromyces marinus]
MTEPAEAAPAPTAPRFRVVSAREAPFADVEAVFGTRGDPAGCWCQWYKLRGAEFDTAPRDELRGRLAAQLAGPEPGPGLIAYDDDTPVGWCAVEPRPALVRLPHGRLGPASPEADFDDPGVWSVSCFVVPRAHRRRGVAGALARAAVEHARSHGARVVEAYAVDTEVRRANGAKTPAADLFPGTVPMYAAAGFVEVARPKPDRAIMQVLLGE